jgi:CRISPR/Cas system-associated endonuclease/helicase Cas3
VAAGRVRRKQMEGEEKRRERKEKKKGKKEKKRKEFFSILEISEKIKDTL